MDGSEEELAEAGEEDEGSVDAADFLRDSELACPDGGATVADGRRSQRLLKDDND